jgi:ketosteroid isomerase-like protein
MPGESALGRAEDVVSRYFQFDASRDVEAILSLFVDDAVVVDEGREWRGSVEIRRWRLGPASKYDYTTTVERVDDIDDTHRQARGRIDGNFPGGTAELVWDFSTVGLRISRLEITPP